MSEPSAEFEEESRPAADSPPRAEAIRAAAELQWSQDPAGAIAVGSDSIDTPASFAQIEHYRYGEQPWMHETFQFERFAGRQVLEIGVGLGTDHLQFARAGAQMTGIDLTARCVELTRSRFAQEGLSSHLETMDAERLQFPDNSFDVVYSFGVLHHIPTIERAFAEIRRVLRPGGVFIGALYNRWSVVVALMIAERIVHAEWRRESFADRLSRVEYSSPTSAEAKPYVRLFGARELTGLLNTAGFGEVEIRRRHFGVKMLERFLPAPATQVLGSTAGWYLIHQAS